MSLRHPRWDWIGIHAITLSEERMRVLRVNMDSELRWYGIAIGKWGFGFTRKVAVRGEPQ